VYQANRNTIVVLISSFPYAINWTQENVPAIIHMTHSSQEEGNALADVLLGDYDPRGISVVLYPDGKPSRLAQFIRDGHRTSNVLPWPELGYPEHVSARVRDLWARKDLGKATGSFSAAVASHSVVMVRIEL